MKANAQALRVDLGSSQFSQAHLGELYELLAEQLLGPSFRNITCWRVLSCASSFSGHHVGQPPAKSPAYTRQHLVFTFAPAYHVPDSGSPARGVFRRNLSVLRQGVNLTELTVGLSAREATERKLHTSPRWLAFLANAVGLLAKSARIHRASFMSNYERTQSRALEALHGSYWSTPFNRVFELPYALWPFCREAWNYPNLLSRKVLTDKVALYYFCYVWPEYGRTRPSLSVRADFQPVRAILVQALRDSLLRLKHVLGTMGDLSDDPVSLIAPVVLYYRRHGRLELDIAELSRFIFEEVELSDSSINFLPRP